MSNLTPHPTNTYLLMGITLASIEALTSFYTDKLLLNGAIFESLIRLIIPTYEEKIICHEAGHLLCAYILGCSIEGIVLSSWEALSDVRFGGKQTTVSAGTSFFDLELSQELLLMNEERTKRMSRTTTTTTSTTSMRKAIDRYSIVVMGGIAAEAICFGRADGGASDEMALVKLLSQLNYSSSSSSSSSNNSNNDNSGDERGGSSSNGQYYWNANMIRNQARWSVMQAILLLRYYEPCYKSLVHTLEHRHRHNNNNNTRQLLLGECIYAIEQTAMEYGLDGLMMKPLGYVLDDDNNNGDDGGKWVPNNDGDDNNDDDITQANDVIGNNNHDDDGNNNEKNNDDNNNSLMNENDNTSSSSISNNNNNNII